MSSLVNRNIVVSGRRTSVRLEPQMWSALAEIAGFEDKSVHEICSDVDRFRRESSLTAGLRVFILRYFRDAATPEGHARAGHSGGVRAIGSRGEDPSAAGTPVRQARRRAPG